MKSAIQREYTTPTLKPGTRYEVEVWAVSGNLVGSRQAVIGTTNTTTSMTLYFKFQLGMELYYK